MKKEAIISDIRELLKERFAVNEESLSEEHWNEPLTGPLFKFSGNDLFYLLTFLEERFPIHYEEINFENYCFNTIGGIIKSTASYF